LPEAGPISVPQSKTGWILVVIYGALSAFLIIQAFTCVDWVCDLIEFPITIPFGLLFFAVLRWLDPNTLAMASQTSPTEGVGRRQAAEIPGMDLQRSALQGMSAHAASRLFRAVIFGGG
jgi:hypothetical protein